MLIRGRRIRELDRHLRGVAPGVPVVIGLSQPSRFSRRLIEIGFSPSLEAGERVLPATVGPRTRYNAEGDYLVHKDQPMETAYRQVEWRWTEFRGRYDTEEMSKIVDVPYQRYPRTFRPPPSVELTVALKSDNTKYIVAEAVDSRPLPTLGT